MRDAREPLDPVEAVYRAIRNLVQGTAGIKLYDFQREIIRRIVEAVLKHEGSEVVVECARQAGKSEAVADVAFGCTLLLPELFPQRWGGGRGFRVGIYAPTLEQSRIIFDRLRDRFTREVLRLADVTVEQSNGNTFALSNGSVVRCLTASPDAKKEGHTWDLEVVDEAQDVESDVLKKALFPMVTATGGPRVLIGTPTDTPRYFFEALSRLQGTRDAFLFTVDRVIEDRRRMARVTGDDTHLTYEKSFQRELRRRGRDDSIRSQYYLEWVLGAGMFMTADQLLRCAKAYDRIRSTDGPTFAGWDVAKEHDRSVLTIETLHAPKTMMVDTGVGRVEVQRGERLWDADVERYHSFVLDWVEWEGDDYPKQVGDVVAILRRYPGLVNLTLDETGVGAVVRDMLKLTELAGRVNTFNFGSGGQKVSDLWTDLQLVMANKATRHFPMGKDWSRGHGFNGELDIETARFIEEFLGAQKAYRGQLLKVQAPEGDRYHDDYCASSALSNWGIRNTAGVRIDLIADPTEKDKTLTVDGLFERTEPVEAEFVGRQRKPIFIQGTP